MGTSLFSTLEIKERKSWLKESATLKESPCKGWLYGETKEERSYQEMNRGVLHFGIAKKEIHCMYWRLIRELLPRWDLMKKGSNWSPAVKIKALKSGSCQAAGLMRIYWDVYKMNNLKSLQLNIKRFMNQE